MDLDPICDDQIERRVKLKSDLDAQFLGANEGKRARLLDDFPDAFDLPISFTACDKLPQSSNDLAGAKRLFSGPFHCIEYLARARVGGVLEKFAGALQVIGYSGQRLI